MLPLDFNKLDLSFDPPLWKKPRRGKRHVSLITETGAMLAGITVYYRKGQREEIAIPDKLSIENLPDYGNPKLPLTQLDREALRMLIREKLRYRPVVGNPVR